MIEAVGVTKTFDQFTAIENLNCTVQRGSIFGLVGHNGAGKTTLLKTMIGIYRADSGYVTVDGENVFDNADIKSRMFFVPDDPHIFFQGSMKRMAQFYRNYFPGWSDAVFQKLVGIFGLDPHKKMLRFSKGMQRQAFIIIALSARPDILLLDEAFDGIDPMMRDLVRQLLLEGIAEKEMCIMISSHNLRELEGLCDTIGVMNDRHIVFESNVDDMHRTKNRYRAVFQGNIPEERLRPIAYRNFVQEDMPGGHMITFTADGEPGEIENIIQSLHPIMLEILPLTLEEIFLREMEVKRHDFKDIFQ